MVRWINGEIAFGFVMGVLTLLAILTVGSYQFDHCGVIDIYETANSNQTETAASLVNNEKRRGEIDKYNDSHPISCGVVGIFAGRRRIYGPS
jgi:hypothetical protein